MVWVAMHLNRVLTFLVSVGQQVTLTWYVNLSIYNILLFDFVLRAYIFHIMGYVQIRWGRLFRKFWHLTMSVSGKKIWKNQSKSKNQFPQKLHNKTVNRKNLKSTYRSLILFHFLLVNFAQFSSAKTDIFLVWKK